MKKQIHQQVMNQWQQQIKSNKLDLKSETSWIKMLSLKTHKLTFSTIMQLKLNHEYFKSYLYRLKHTNSFLCRCKRKQTAEHLIVQCSNYRYEQKEMKLELNQLILNFKYLTTTNKELNALIKYLQKTLMMIRKWQLRLTDIDIKQWQSEEEWEDIEQID